MGYGTLNIWLRGEDCGLINAYHAKLEIKTCLGENFIEMLPKPDFEKMKAHLQEMYPECSVFFNETFRTIAIHTGDSTKKIINHMQVNVPPGCYVVRVHQCGVGNEWTDRTMVVVGCGEEACVNLILKDAESCMREGMIPFLRLAEIARLPREHVQVAVDMLRTAGRWSINEIARELEVRVKAPEDRKEASKVVSEAESGLKIIKDLRLRAKKET